MFLTACSGPAWRGASRTDMKLNKAEGYLVDERTFCGLSSGLNNAESRVLDEIPQHEDQTKVRGISYSPPWVV